MTGLGSDFREEFAEVPLKSRVWKFNPVAIVGIPLAAILFQVYVPRFFQFLSYLELPLLVTVYFGLMRRSPEIARVGGLLSGVAAITRKAKTATIPARGTDTRIMFSPARLGSALVSYESTLRIASDLSWVSHAAFSEKRGMGG